MPTPIWAGSIVLAGIVGFLLSYVMFPPFQPIEKYEGTSQARGLAWVKCTALSVSTKSSLSAFLGWPQEAI
jgi:hypothetical protein